MSLRGTRCAAKSKVTLRHLVKMSMGANHGWLRRRRDRRRAWPPSGARWAVVHGVLSRFKRGALFTGSGKLVTDRRQALAIALALRGPRRPEDEAPQAAATDR
jgi:hypothetical protein